MDEEGQEKEVSLTEALETKTAEARAHAKAEADKAEQDMLDQLTKLEESARSSRRSLERAHAREEAKAQETQETGRGLGVGLSIAYAIIGVPLAGFAVGYLIDRRPNGPFASGLTVAGAVAGVAYAIMAVNRHNKP
ncbi:MAG: hypothetical protein JSS65_14700 [Armatimonadetes bacterium]|nr:hypothetical protein [Armatimonadota bacterium]